MANAPTDFYRSPAKLRIGRFPLSCREGELIFTSQSVRFRVNNGATLFEYPLNKILRITIHRRRALMLIKTRQGTQKLCFSHAEPWMYILFYIGLLFLIVPGFLIYILLIVPNIRSGTRPVKRWQREFAKHAIRTV